MSNLFESGSITAVFYRSYVATALWSSNDESDESGGNPLDQNYDIDDIADETLAQMQADCHAFYEAAMAGHDFWLTRCGHGAGFWDGDWPEPAATALDNASKEFGNVDLYVGDDGQIYA